MALPSGEDAMKGRKGVVILMLLLFLTAVVAVMVGGVHIGPLDALTALVGSDAESLTRTIIWDIRIPRILLAILVGAGIATAGAAIQGLFRNPLADPALIGVSSGAALFAALFIVVGGSLASGLIGIAGSAFVGGLVATWVVLIVGSRGGGISTMLLAGIAINAIALAGVGLLTYLSTDNQLRSVTFWALGSINGANWTSVAIALVIPVAAYFIYREAINLNAVTLGDEEAEYLGVSHRKLRRRIVLLTAFSVGIGVALTGVIAFIGLIVPHLVRMTVGSSHLVLIPSSGLLGGMLLLLADTISRSAFAPVELPVGILTALIGGPFFVYLIIVEQKERFAL